MKSFVRTDTVPGTTVEVESTTTSSEPSLPGADGSQQAPPAAVVVRPSSSVGHPGGSAMFEGEIRSSDIIKPVLTVVHGVGPRSAVFAPGSVVVGESVVFTPPTRPSDPTRKIRVVFGHLVKTYLQNLPYSDAPGTARPLMFKTMAEVEAVGGVLTWNNNVPPSFIERLSGLVLARCPEGCSDDSVFNIIDGDHTYAPALVAFQKTSYPAAEKLLTDLHFRLKMDPTAAYYDLYWAKEKKGNNWVYCAKLARVQDEVPSESVKQRLAEVCGRGVESTEVPF